MAKKISLEKLFRVVSLVLSKHNINPKGKSMGVLLDAMGEYPDYDDVTTYLCQVMGKTSDTNRSTFIAAFFEYHKLPFVPSPTNATRYSANGKPISRLGNVKRKSKTR